MFRNGFCTEFSGVGETFHGSRLLFHAPGTVRERTGYSKWLETMVCAMYLKVFRRAHRCFRDGKSDQGIMKRTRQSLKSIEKVIPKERISKEKLPRKLLFS